MTLVTKQKNFPFGSWISFAESSIGGAQLKLLLFPHHVAVAHVHTTLTGPQKLLCTLVPWYSSPRGTQTTHWSAHAGCSEYQSASQEPQPQAYCLVSVSGCPALLPW